MVRCIPNTHLADREQCVYNASRVTILIYMSLILHNMARKIAAGAVVVSTVLVPVFVYADTLVSKTATLSNPLKVDTVGGVVQNFVEIFSYVIILFAVLALVYVGLRFIMARGNPEEMSRLKEWLFWIIVGVAVVIGARIIVEVVINTLSASGAVNSNIINSAKDALRTH